MNQLVVVKKKKKKTVGGFTKEWRAAILLQPGVDNSKPWLKRGIF